MEPPPAPDLLHPRTLPGVAWRAAGAVVLLYVVIALYRLVSGGGWETSILVFAGFHLLVLWYVGALVYSWRRHA